MVNFKHYKKSYKKKRSYNNPQEKWVIFEDAHPAIIGKAQFERVQELCKHKRRLTKSGNAGLFSGILYCADCKSKLHFRTCKSYNGSQDNYVCAQYKNAMGQCTAHFIREETLKNVVLEHIQRVLLYIQQFEEIFVRSKYERSFSERRKGIAVMKRDITKANRRIEELDRLFKHIYEDSVSGKLTDERFQTMSADYEAEQRQLKVDVARMDADVAKGEEVTADFQAFLANVRKYTEITELTPTILNEFIQRIEVHAPGKDANGKRTQQIDIFYNAVGVIDIPVLEEIMMLHAEDVAQKQQGRRSPKRA